ncbi:MAG: substrate-binding domain-containing protein, partial [Victivallaceae bacterium]
DFNDAQNRLLHYDAVFFIGDEEYCELINNMLTSKQTQVCLIDPSNKEKNCLQLSLSLKESAYRAVSFMARNGYRRIAYIGSDHHPEGKLSGYKLALKEYGLPLIEKNIIIGINAQTDGQRGVSILMGHGMDCDSIFVDTDSKAAGVITYLAQQGLKVPEDIGVMGFDGLDVFVKAPPYLTTVKTCFKEVIEKALELLREKDRNEIIERCIEYPGKIIVNRTTFNGKNLTTNPEPLNYSSPLIMNNV